MGAHVHDLRVVDAAFWKRDGKHADGREAAGIGYVQADAGQREVEGSRNWSPR